MNIKKNNNLLNNSNVYGIYFNVYSFIILSYCCTFYCYMHMYINMKYFLWFDFNKTFCVMCEYFDNL